MKFKSKEEETEYLRLKVLALETLIEVAEKDFGIEIIKKRSNDENIDGKRPTVDQKK